TPPAAVATAPVPPPAAAKPPEAPAQAALPPVAPAGDRVMQISFAGGESRLPSDVQGRLKDLAEQMKTKEALRMQLVAYAAGGDLSSSAARRLSLSRALAVRTFLIDNGVRSTRIDVRALGDKAPDEPANRVDVSLSER
ncbi:MAG: OmpA family protein, partial [Pseudomonadota bacterium]